MTFRIGRNSLFGGKFPRLQFIDPATDGTHQQYNKRFPLTDSFANAEFTAYPNSLSIHLTEGHKTESGRVTSRTISIEFNPIIARQLRDFLDKHFPDLEE